MNAEISARPEVREAFAALSKAFHFFEDHGTDLLRLEYNELVFEVTRRIEVPEEKPQEPVRRSAQNHNCPF